jgi:uncharacterized membrane protein
MGAGLKLTALYGLMVPVFFALDMVWLGVLARGFYRRHLGDLLRPEVNWTAAIVFYLLFIAGILLFAVLPGLRRESLLHAALLGIAFGFIAYATYDLTNLATLRDWPLALTLVDMLWGAVLSGSVAAAGYVIGRRLGVV